MVSLNERAKVALENSFIGTVPKIETATSMFLQRSRLARGVEVALSKFQIRSWKIFYRSSQNRCSPEYRITLSLRVRRHRIVSEPNLLPNP